MEFRDCFGSGSLRRPVILAWGVDTHMHGLECIERSAVKSNATNEAMLNGVVDVKRDG